MAAIRASMRRFQVARAERDDNKAALRALVEAARVSLAKEEVERDVEEKDFTTVVQLDLPREARRFQASEFAPLVLQKFRRFANVSAADLRNSLCDGSMPVRDSSSQGRSGALFFRTQDCKFLIKCLTKTDVKAIRRMLSDLYAHINSFSASLLSPPLALFKVDPPMPKSLAVPSKFFLITRHIAPEARLILDLKGCLLHRRATTAPVRSPQAVYHVLKDRDILESRAQLVLASPLRSPLLSQLHDDLEFLNNRGIIDYSLLLAVTETGKKRRKAEETKKEEERAEMQDAEVNDVRKTLSKDGWEVIEEEPEVRMRRAEGRETVETQHEERTEEKDTEDATERAKKGVKADVKEEEERSEEREASSSSGIPVRLRINSFVNSTLPKPHAVLQDLSDVLPGSLRLHVNIIDYLTHYGLYHRVSGLVKHIRYGANVSMSTEPPSQYRFRLQAFAEHVVTSV